MSQFITDEELEKFAQEVLEDSGRRKALEIKERIRAHKEYMARAECACETNKCECYLPMTLEPDRIQAGDTFVQTAPNGEKITLGALGTRHRGVGSFEIFTGGWPPAIVRIPEHGTAELLRKGKGITKHELKHRRAHFGGGWDDGL